MKQWLPCDVDSRSGPRRAFKPVYRNLESLRQRLPLGSLTGKDFFLHHGICPSCSCTTKCLAERLRGSPVSSNFPPLFGICSGCFRLSFRHLVVGLQDEGPRCRGAQEGAVGSTTGDPPQPSDRLMAKGTVRDCLLCCGLKTQLDKGQKPRAQHLCMIWVSLSYAGGGRASC